MTVNINSPVFNAGTTGVGKVTQALIDAMNSSPTFVKLFDSLRNFGKSILIGNSWEQLGSDSN